MSFYSDEYKHLLAAERAIVAEVEALTKDSNLPMLARALVDIIQQKRNMRGSPNPKPVDMTDAKRHKRRPAAPRLDAQDEPLPPEPGPGPKPAA